MVPSEFSTRQINLTRCSVHTEPFSIFTLFIRNDEQVEFNFSTFSRILKREPLWGLDCFFSGFLPSALALVLL